jgi:hypothetical protein
VTAASRGLAIGLLLVASLAGGASAQAPPCATGSGTLKASAIGSDVLREGSGFGAVSLGGSAADVERAWGAPAQCRQQGGGVTYTYFLTHDTEDSALLLVVSIESGRVNGILASLLPHSGGRGPSVRTGRGVGLLASLDDVVRAHGSPPDPAARTWIYAADGVAFTPSKGLVAAIAVFPLGAVPAIFQR